MRHLLRVLLAGFVSCSAVSLMLPPSEARADVTVLTAGDAGISLGGEFRLRGEGFDNALDLADSLRDGYNYYRFRTRVWLDAKPRQGMQIFFRLGNEYRWGRGEKEAGVRDVHGKLSLDNGWADFALPLVPDLTFRFGRQELSYGEGFLLWDGTPADGSGSSYFDAMRLRWKQGPAVLDLLTAKIDDEGFGSPARDEDLYGVYASCHGFDLYTLYRNKRGETKMDDTGIVHPVQQTTAIGGRAAFLPDTGWHLAAEGTYQTGSRAHEQERAYGGYSRGGWTSSRRLHPALEIGGLYLSGDDPSTARWEGWDGFYSDWPKYSELYICTLSDFTTRIPGDDPGTWTNLSAVWVEGRLKTERTLSCAVRCSLLRAPEATGPGGGEDRGLLLAGQANLNITPDLQGQILGEILDPGDYYLEIASTAWYGRWQLTARF